MDATKQTLQIVLEMHTAQPIQAGATIQQKAKSGRTAVITVAQLLLKAPSKA